MTNNMNTNAVNQEDTMIDDDKSSTSASEKVANDERKKQHKRIKVDLKKSILKRVSLSPVEMAFLRCLLLDEDPGRAEIVETGSNHIMHEALGDAEGDSVNLRTELIQKAKGVLDDELLFSTPFVDDIGGERNIVPPRSKRKRQNHMNLIGLWRAHEDGVAPSMLLREAARRSSITSSAAKLGTSELDSINNPQAVADMDDLESDLPSIASDKEIRPERKGLNRLERKENGADVEDVSSTSSWDMSEGGFDHYDAWEVLKDEYADDFGMKGYAFSEELNKGEDRFSEDDVNNDDRALFKILGTSADDVTARPHVLSPPLMDSLYTFLPDTLANENLWLQFSLVRDGASLEILKKYVRAARCTILAIETTAGDVFGAFTSSPWRTSHGYFGTGEAFLWRMRHSRLSPCHSLLEQAQLESEVDIYPYSGLNNFVQLCSKSKLAIGGGEIKTSKHGHHQAALPVLSHPFRVSLDKGQNYGFGLAISDDLLRGTSSPCATFRNPCLCNHASQGEVFEISNLEVWTFTSGESVDQAEKLQMSTFFAQESVESSIRGISQSSDLFSSQDFTQEEFYRRVGMDDDNALDRVGWEYSNMMNGGL
mmetsp:Transcript_1813/g.3222  ORF Transcript_1813/g.3222 Transcript_1813/m.3222 type:complete len:596 (-) Transcript_1813:1785-3572(-)